MRHILVLFALASCADPKPRGPTPRDQSTAPADPVAMRALLARYSPGGHAILTTYEALPTSFTFVDGGPWEFGEGIGFDSYLSDGGVENTVRYLATGVHEIAHGYMSRMAMQLLVDRGLPYGKGAEAIIADGDPWLVPHTETFPSTEIDATFPADARSSRYAEYVGERAGPTLGSNVLGVYGLLDEFAAYYQGARTAHDLWAWVHNEAPPDQWLAINYAVGFGAEIDAYADFKLYILHYLVHAREHHPEIYEAVLANEAFRRAFTDVDDAYGTLAAAMRELEPTIHAFVGTRGVDLERQGGGILIGGNVQQPEFVAPNEAVLVHLDEEPYRAMLSALRLDE